MSKSKREKDLGLEMDWKHRSLTLPKRRLRARLLTLAVSASVLALACASAAPAPPPPSDGPVGPYVIGVSDRLMVSVWRNPELTAQVVVRTDGKISVPLVDDVQAAGLTTGELKEVISAALAEYVTSPHVSVAVQEMNSRRVSVMGGGAVRQGTVPLKLKMRVLDAIVSMGGFSTWAKTKHIRVLRDADGEAGPQTLEYRFNYDAYVAGRAPTSNLVLQPGDTIIIPD